MLSLVTTGKGTCEDKEGDAVVPLTRVAKSTYGKTCSLKMTCLDIYVRLLSIS
jgi:hypothetical protein